MKAIVFPGNETAEIRDFPEPVAGPGEVVVRIRASGMCGSDLHFYRGSEAFGDTSSTIQGHEPCGDVHSVGPGVSEAMATVGNRVMIHHYWGCQACRRCRAGWPQMCETFPAYTMAVTAHGGHAPYALVPATTLLPLPDELSYRAGAAIGCGTGTAWGGIKRLGNIADTTTVIFGQGPVGLSGTMFASAMGARVIAVDIDDSRLERSLQFGASAAINPTQQSLVDTVNALTGGRGADVVLETSGRAGDGALSVLGTFGRACFLGLPGEVAFSAQQHYKKQWTLMTSWTMSTIEQQRCAEFVVAHNLPIDELYSHTWKLEQAPEAYEWFAQQSAGKGVFVFDD